MGKVTTYINSGNVIFQESRRKPSTIVSILEKAIEDDLGLQIRVLLRDLSGIKKVMRRCPTPGPATPG